MPAHRVQRVGGRYAGPLKLQDGRAPAVALGEEERVGVGHADEEGALAASQQVVVVSAGSDSVAHVAVQQRVVPAGERHSKASRQSGSLSLSLFWM